MENRVFEGRAMFDLSERIDEAVDATPLVETDEDCVAFEPTLNETEMEGLLVALAQDDGLMEDFMGRVREARAWIREKYIAKRREP